jgi:hypothetical protein
MSIKRDDEEGRGRSPDGVSDTTPGADDSGAEVEAILGEYLEAFDTRNSPSASGRDVVPGEVDDTVATIFDILTHRRFSHLSRRQAQPYRDGVTSLLRADVSRGRPTRFYYDLGPGYHASIDLASPELSFEPGLGEMIALRQIVRLLHRVQGVYPPGAAFWLIIDNLCGLATNDIPLERTEAYVVRLRRLIEQLRLEARISVLVESELNSWETYRDRLEQEAPDPHPEVTPSDVQNVARFLGRSCDPSEAAARMELYSRTGRVTEELLAPAIEGVRLTQRATPSTLGFRAFPGGDQRIQSGQLALSPDSTGRVRPILITTYNTEQYDLQWISPPEDLPTSVRRLLWAERRDPTKKVHP